MNARDIITDALQQIALHDYEDGLSWEDYAEAALAALRRAAGGADRVVLDWSGTPCATCGGREAERDGSGYVSFCGACGGSGSGDDVVLHGLEGVEGDNYLGRPAWRLVPVTPSEAKS